MIHVYAIDVSLSTNDIQKFESFIYTLKNNNKRPESFLDTVYWAKTAKLCFNDSYIDSNRSNETESRPSTLISLLAENFEEPFVLHIFTYGKIHQNEVDKCKKMLKEYNLSKKIKSVQIYFPNDGEFNLNFADIFSDYNVSIRKIAKFNTLNEFFRKKQIDKCIKYVQKNYTDSISKIRLQMQALNNLKSFLNDSKDKDELKYLIKKFKRLKYTEFFDNELECGEIYNDDLFNISKPMCIAVCQNVKPIPFTDQDAKKIAQNPFNAFDIIEKALNLLKPEIVKYEHIEEMFNLETMSDLKYQKCYMLHNNEKTSVFYGADKNFFKAMIKHNNYVLSSLFDHKLPGKKVLWQIIFLYSLAKKVKPFVENGWKEMLFNEIKYLTDNDGHYLYLDNYKEPSSYEALRVCFWFLAEISHRAFPDSNKNMYKSWENMPQFFQFYKDVFNPKIESPVDMNQWKLWRLFYSKHNLTHLLSHFYGFKQNSDGTETVLFHDLPVQKAIKPLKWIQEMGRDVFINMYKLYWVRRKRFSYKDFDEQDSHSKLNFIFQHCEGCNEKEFELLDHVKINLETGRPYVNCQITERHWKRCIRSYNVHYKSNVKLFRNYCTKNLKYPDNAVDLLAYKRDTLRNLYKNTYPIFHSQEEECMEKILKIYQNVINEMPFDRYLEMIKTPMSEETRLKYEKQFVNKSLEELNEYSCQRNALFEKIKVYTIQKQNARITIGNFTMNLFQKIDVDTCNEIKKYLTPSSFGQGQDRVYDESIRKSLETTKFNLNFDLKCQLDGNIVPYKLVLYEQDCFFDWHLDTHEQGLLGTFIIELNSDYEGGKLILKSLDKELQPFTFPKKNKELLGCFFPHDIPHKVEKVINGSKISLIFKVHEKNYPLYVKETKEYSDQTLKELVNKINLKIHDVVWCSDNTIINYLKESNKFNIYEVISLEDVDIDTFIYPKNIYDTIRDKEDMYENEVDWYLEYYCSKIRITNIIQNREKKQAEGYRYLYGRRGNSPCSETKYTDFYDGYAILHKDNPLNDDMLKDYKEYKKMLNSDSDSYDYL